MIFFSFSFQFVSIIPLKMIRNRWVRKFENNLSGDTNFPVRFWLNSLFILFFFFFYSPKLMW